MGGSSSEQVIGYKYYAGLMVALGNRIEKLIAIRPDNRKWIEIGATANESVIINEPNLFGGDKGEGGFKGVIDVHLGTDDQLQNTYLALKDSPIVSAYPNLSYLVYRGASGDKGFHLVSMSGMLKEVLYWVKRIHIKNDSSPQWYDEKSEIMGIIDGASLIARNMPTSNSDYEVIYITDDSTIETISTSGFPDSFINGINYSDGGTRNITSFVKHCPYLIYKAQGYFISDQIFTDEQLNSVISIIGTEAGFTTVTRTGTANKYDFEAFITPSKDDPESKVGLKVSVQQDGLIINYALEPYSGNGYVAIDAPDINPIHKIREIITDYTAMNKPEAMINDTNFKAAADRIWDEGLGVSGSFTEKSCKEAIDELLYHIEAGIRVNRQTGLYEVILFRDDLLDLDNAQVFNESNIKSFNIEVANIDDMINSVNVNYYDRDNIKDSSFSLDELGSILSSQSNAETIDFPYFMNRRNAELVGNWKLKQFSTPTRKGSFTTGKYDARKINRYDVIKLSWLNQGFADLPVRIMKIGLGDGRDNTVTLEWVEVIPYSNIVFPTINVDPPTSVILPPQIADFIAFEAPYFEAVQNMGQAQVDAELANNPDAGFVGVAALKPQNNSINALLYTDSGAGYSETSVVNYAPSCVLDQNIGYLDTTFAVKNITSLPSANTTFMLDDEIMVFVSFDGETGIMTVKRGALDTVPQPHLLDSRIWFYDEFPSFDSTEYVISEVVNAKVLTTTPSGILDIAAANEASVTLNARAIRPYPPANVKINDEYYPEEIETDLIVTWVDRNRVQQTGGEIIGWYEGGVTIEDGVEYIVELYDADDMLVSSTNVGTANTATVDYSAVTTATCRIKMYSVRNGYESVHAFEHDVTISFNPPYSLSGTWNETSQSIDLVWEFNE